MYVFLKKTVLFFLILSSLTILLYLLLNYSNKKAISNYKTDPNINTVFLGDSHVQYAVNDHLLPNGINLAQDSESFIFSFYKLHAILENNPGIGKIYLGFGYHSLSSYYDDYIDGKFSKDIAARYFFILPDKEKAYFLNQNSRERGVFFSRIFSNSFKTLFVKPTNLSFLGKYQNPFKSTSASRGSMDKRAIQQYYLNDTIRSFSKVNIDYLQKIIELCKIKNVELVILNTPLHPYYKNKIPARFIDMYRELVNKNGLRVIDFSSLILSDSCFIPDGDHVSEKGATLTTTYLSTLK